MTWVLRTLFVLIAATLALQIFPLSLSPPEFRGAALAALLAAVGLALERLGRKAELAVLSGAMIGSVTPIVWRAPTRKSAA